MRRRACLAISAVFSTLGLAQPVSGAECHPTNGVSPCLDANSLWPATGDARLFTLPSGSVLPAGKVGLGIAVQALFRPLRLNVPTSNDTGRDVEFVKQATELDLGLAVGLGQNLELGVALPMVLRQTGSGSEGYTSQQGAPLDPSAERDPRLSLAYGFEYGPLRFKPRVLAALPLGNREGYASSAGFTFAPALPLTLRHHRRFEHTLEIGARLRPSVDLGSARFGSEGTIALGTSFDVFGNGLLLLCAEAFLLPSLIDNQSARAKAFEVETRLLSAEYLFSLRSRPIAAWSAALGAGSALALSKQTSSAGDEWFVAPPGPALRLLAEVRYSPID